MIFKIHVTANSNFCHCGTQTFLSLPPSLAWKITLFDIANGIGSWVPCKAQGQKAHMTGGRHQLESSFYLGEGRLQSCFSSPALAMRGGQSPWGCRWSQESHKMLKPLACRAVRLRRAERLCPPRPGLVWVELRLGPSSR